MTMLTLRSGGRRNPILGLSPAAYYQNGVGITVTGSGVAVWADQSGNGRNLLQGTDANRPAYDSATGTITFDGSNDSLKATFTLNQPETLYVVVNQVSWTNGDYLLDGNTAASRIIRQDTASPQLDGFAGAFSTNSSALAVGAWGVICLVSNGASSVFRVNNEADITGNFGANNPGAIFLGGRADSAGAMANVAYKEVASFAAAHDAATRTSVISFLMSKFSIT